MSITTRFAPSPTGRLHVGNIRTALHNWMLAKKHGGRFLLRIDDTDAARSREEFVAAIQSDLAWLGIEPDGQERQSARLSLYDEAFERLRQSGRLYPCYESAQELDLKRKVLLGRGLPPIYDRAALTLDEGERAERQRQGVAPHWRFLLNHDEPVEWDDMIRGAQHFDPRQLSDPVVRRADGSWLYMLPSAIDDIAMEVTDVLRGEDHVSNTAVQIQMFTALGASPPRFAHEALLVGAEGKLSKRLGSLSLDALREAGIESGALIALLARLGTAQPVEAISERQVLIDSFDLAHFGRAPARFDEAELERLNAAILHQTPFADVADRLPADMPEAAWHAVRPNIARLSDVAEWWQVISGPIEPPALSPEDRDFVAQAATEQFVWGADPWHTLTGAMKAKTQRKGRGLFLPLRLALTGRDHGPDMAELLPLIGEGEARKRLIAAAGTS